MKRSFLITVTAGILFYFAPLAKAEQTNDADSAYSTVVLFKTGGKVTGKIIEDKPGDRLVVELPNGMRVKAKYRDVEMITRGGEYEVRQTVLLDSLRSAALARTSQHVQIGVFLGSGSNGTGSIVGGSIIGGTEMTTGLFLGAGVGLEFYKDTEDGFLPILVEARARIGENQHSVFFYTRDGWSLGWIENLNGTGYGGLHYEFGIGLVMGESKGEALTISAGYAVQKVSDRHSHIHGSDESIRIEIGAIF